MNVKDGKSAMQCPRCTVFLGDNGTGKTNLLKVIANLSPEIRNVDDVEENDLAVEISVRGKDEKKHKKAYRPNVVERHGEKDYSVSMRFATSNESAECITHPQYKELQKIEKEGKISASQPVSIGYTDKNNTIVYDVPELGDVVIYAYGVNRFSDDKNNLRSENNVETLFYNNRPLINVNQWLIQLELASKDGNTKSKAIEKKKILKKILRNSNLFPDIKDYKVKVDEKLNAEVLFETSYGQFHLSDLAYGYQCMFAWLFDFIKKMFDRYPDSDNPLKEPAILVVDEIDLHLHPAWQRHVLADLCGLFPNTQIIVSTHSPLVIQSIDGINLFVLENQEEGTVVSNYTDKDFQGWRVDEILRDVMKLGDDVRSEKYKALREEFETAITKKKDVESVYYRLKNILQPDSTEAHLLELDYNQANN